ncbi:general secretion pathway protein GspB [Photobacterium sp. Alg240-V54]|uniref:general secretion pathway protein GspB n=1 Tax=Photobacterium sp. Alg240-V54 TaxID=2305995 RepID=UPI0013D39232|nr:general secretion pathway protein GspB [Photobacterium sp. Alg240-V54]
MSQLLTALKQSDTKNTQQSSNGNSDAEAMKIVHPMRAVKAQQSRSKWILPILIALLPAASIVAYKLYQQSSVVPQVALNNQPVHGQVLSAPINTVLQPPQKPQSAPTTTAGDVIFMSYPEMVTEPLPINDSLYSAAPAYVSHPDVNPSFDDSDSQYGDLGPTYDDVVTKPVKRAAKVLPASHDPYKLDNLDLSDLSPDLAAKLKSAIVATDGTHYQDSDVDRSPAERNASAGEVVSVTPAVANNQVTPIGLLPAAVQRQLPKMNFNQHIYSSTPAKRWVKVNGHERHQGDMVATGVKLVKIESRDVILAFDGYQFSMPALSEW